MDAMQARVRNEVSDLMSGVDRIDEMVTQLLHFKSWAPSHQHLEKISDHAKRSPSHHYV